MAKRVDQDFADCEMGDSRCRVLGCCRFNVAGKRGNNEKKLKEEKGVGV